MTGEIFERQLLSSLSTLRLLSKTHIFFLLLLTSRPKGSVDSTVGLTADKSQNMLVASNLGHLFTHRRTPEKSNL